MHDYFFGTHSKLLNKENWKVVDFYSGVLIWYVISLSLVSIYTYSNIPLDSLVWRHFVKWTQYVKMQIISVHKNKDRSVFPTWKGLHKGGRTGNRQWFFTGLGDTMIMSIFAVSFSIEVISMFRIWTPGNTFWRSRTPACLQAHWLTDMFIVKCSDIWQELVMFSQ